MRDYDWDDKRRDEGSYYGRHGYRYDGIDPDYDSDCDDDLDYDCGNDYDVLEDAFEGDADLYWDWLVN